MEDFYRQKLSPHFMLYEFTRSGAAIDAEIENKPEEKHIEALTALCENILEPLRGQFGPIIISSGFRSQAVNRLVGGVPSSQHLKGEAADIVTGNKDRAISMFRFIKRNLNFDQLILEPIGSENPRWIHVSYTTKRKNRHQIVTQS